MFSVYVYPYTSYPSMHDLTAFQRDLMFVISGLDEPKGLDIKEIVNSYYWEDIRHGRLYPNLDALVEKGLVEKGQHDQRTNKYVLTEYGKREIEARVQWQFQMLSDEIKEDLNIVVS